MKDQKIIVREYVKERLNEIFDKVPRVSVTDSINGFVVTIYPANAMEMDSIKSISVVKKWIKESGISFSRLKGSKYHSSRFGFDEIWCEVYR